MSRPQVHIVEKPQPDKAAAAASSMAKSLAIAGDLPDSDLIERAKIWARDGKLLTAQNSEFAISESTRQICALFDNGLFLIARGHEGSSEFYNLYAMAKDRGLPIEQPRSIPMGQLAEIYQNVRRGQTGEISAGETQGRLRELIGEAVKRNATDIHIVLTKATSRISFRIYGALVHYRDIRPDEGFALVGGAFAATDSSDNATGWANFRAARITQSASKILPIEIDLLRLQYSPNANDGGKCVMRLLRSARDDNTDIESLGYTELQKQDFQVMRLKSVGFNAISGPTGSGKTTTLQRALIAELREKRGEISVYTIEDPPELPIPGAAQIPIMNANSPGEREQRYTEAIRAALRSDPDVIMVGEIRDRQAAELTFQAVLSGHQVWCSVHANSALGILDRLRDVGVDEWKLRDPALISGLVAQRLVRLLCPACSQSLVEAVEAQLVDRERARLAAQYCGVSSNQLRYRGTGCDAKGCVNGFVGRTVCAETLIPDGQLLDLYFSAKSAARAYWLREMRGHSMIQHGLQLLTAGKTDLVEIEEKVALLSELDGKGAG